jgi:hypothetical protein
MSTSVALNPIEIAVSPLKDLAIERAAQAAHRRVESLREQLKENDYNINAVAPYPDYHKMSRIEFQVKVEYHRWAKRMVKTNPNRPPSYQQGLPHYVVMNSSAVASFFDDVRKQAAAHYEAYVAKLNHKIGKVTEATLTYCRHDVWDDSILTVTKVDGTTERWSTKIILNHSVHGKLFNQWPTRKLKGVKK